MTKISDGPSAVEFVPAGYPDRPPASPLLSPDGARRLFATLDSHFRSWTGVSLAGHLTGAAAAPDSPPSQVHDPRTLERLFGVLVDRLAAVAGAAPSAAPGPQSVPSPTGSPVPLSRLIDVTEALCRVRAKDGAWIRKSERQARSIADLLVRFAVEELDISDLRALGQAEMARFVEFLRYDIYRAYGRSARDRSRSIAELRDVAMARPPAERGLKAQTLNRHLIYLSQIFAHASALGIPTATDLDLKKLRGRTDRRRARNERSKLDLDAFARVFRAPHYVGGAGGGAVVHDALYWVPMLIFYTGARREEVCGALLDDVVTDNGPIPYLHISFNDRRRIKNDQSVRNVPLHPELIRLGFLDYVARLKALGHTLLFPDLHSPTTDSPLGDRFYKLFKPVLVGCGVTEKGLAVHAIRHLFGDVLKKKRVAQEDRADLLGHGGDSETTERYCSAHDIETLHSLVTMLPPVTSHLDRRAVALVPWVERGETAPFSRPRRAKTQQTKPSQRKVFDRRGKRVLTPRIPRRGKGRAS